MSSENIVGKGENAGNQHFLLFPLCFLSEIIIGITFILSAANAVKSMEDDNNVTVCLVQMLVAGRTVSFKIRSRAVCRFVFCLLFTSCVMHFRRHVIDIILKSKLLAIQTNLTPSTFIRNFLGSSQRDFVNLKATHFLIG